MRNMDSCLFPVKDIFELAEVLANLSNEGFELLKSTLKIDYGLCVEKELIAKISTFANEQKDLLEGLDPQSNFRKGEITAYNAILSFLSTLEESEIPNDLEEAKEAYCEEHNDECFDAIGSKCPHIRNAFIAGAKWQEKKDQDTIKLAEDHAFLAGADWQREQMMKEADDYDNIGVGKISEHIGDGNEVLKKFEFTDRKDIVGFQGDKGRWAVGDKVKVYIKKFEQFEFNKSE